MVVIELIVRLPINLCYESEDTDFDLFLKEKLEQKNLSSLIINLLHVYQENAEIRKIVDRYIDNK